MSGDPTASRLWHDADVYIAFDLDETRPATIDEDFGAGWDLVGLLDGEEGFTESREEEVSDHFAWGGILMRTGRRNFMLTKSFTAFEHNETTRRLRWPGSEAGEIKVPRPESVLIAFETVDNGVKHRVISRLRAEVTIDGDITENESDPASLPFVAKIYPDADGVLFDEQETAPASS